MTGGITAVASRMVELRQLVTPAAATLASASTTASVGASTSTSTSTSTGTSFAAALAALGIDTSSVAGLGGATSATGATGTTRTTLASASGTSGQDLVAAAQAYIGVPYVWGGESLDEGGLDCSGLVQRSLADLGITGVPRVARDQMTLGTAVPSLDQALPGDLLVFDGGSHIAIYMGDGTMIDAPKPGGSVAVRDVYTAPSAIRRILPQASTSAVDAASGAGAGSAGAAASDARLAAALATASAQRTALGLVGPTSTASVTTGSGITSATGLDAATWAVAS